MVTIDDCDHLAFDLMEMIRSFHTGGGVAYVVLLLLFLKGRPQKQQIPVVQGDWARTSDVPDVDT